MQDDLPFSLWLFAFVWTNALELPVWWLALRKEFPRWWQPVALCLVVNSITHPTLWYLLPRFGSEEVWIPLAEGWVTATEALLAFAALRWVAHQPARRAAVRAVAASVAANVFSTLAGMLIWRLFGFT
ncbi:MAG TPA: hypothetical protein VMV18_14965 [bacterium]|nr:hypothetical protein [bacterium]